MFSLPGIQCDGKMLKMQKQQQQMKTQANLSSSASTDIFRKVRVTNYSQLHTTKVVYVCMYVCDAEAAAPQGRV